MTPADRARIAAEARNTAHRLHRDHGPMPDHLVQRITKALTEAAQLVRRTA